MRIKRVIYTKNAQDSDGKIGDYLLIFHHNISKGDVFLSVKDFLFANEENKYSIFGFIDDSFKYDGKKFEFLMEYPDDNTHGFWLQNINPWKAEPDSDVGYIDKGKNFKGMLEFTGLTRHSSVYSFLDGISRNIGEWYYSIGLREPWGKHNSIPGSYAGENPPIYEVFLWMRIPSFSFLKAKSFGVLTCRQKMHLSFRWLFCIILFIS